MRRGRRDYNDRDEIGLAQHDLLGGRQSRLFGRPEVFVYFRGRHKDEHDRAYRGPFDNVIRPFTVNGSNTLVFVNINGLLGFEVGDLRSGKKLFQVEVQGYKQGPVKRHGCPSHGIALTPDEKELW